MADRGLSSSKTAEQLTLDEAVDLIEFGASCESLPRNAARRPGAAPRPSRSSVLGWRYPAAPAVCDVRQSPDRRGHVMAERVVDDVDDGALEVERSKRCSLSRVVRFAVRFVPSSPRFVPQV